MVTKLWKVKISFEGYTTSKGYEVSEALYTIVFNTCTTFYSTKDEVPHAISLKVNLYSFFYFKILVACAGVRYTAQQDDLTCLMVSWYDFAYHDIIAD